MTVRRFTTTVEAIQYRHGVNEREVCEFVGQSEPEMNGDVLLLPGANEAIDTDWVLRDPSGDGVAVCDTDYFTEHYTEVS